jgi:hypothetical protein
MQPSLAMLDVLLEMFSFRTINTDQADSLTFFHQQRIAINDTLHDTVITGQ